MSSSGELVINTWPSYTSISNAAVGNTIRTVIEYIPGQHDSNINIQNVYTATTQTYCMRIVAIKWF